MPAIIGGRSWGPAFFVTIFTAVPVSTGAAVFNSWCGNVRFGKITGSRAWGRSNTELVQKMKILLKWKIWRIEAALNGILRQRGIKPYVWSFGAYYIDPKHLIFVVGVPTDSEREKLKSDVDFDNDIRHLLVNYNWPFEARKHVFFDIESQETVDRENNGNWWYHYK